MLSKSGGMAHSPSIRFSAPRTATRSWARAVGVMATVVVGGCSENAESCSKCPGTNVGPVGDCVPTSGLILYEIVIDETLYTLVCGHEPAEELTPLDYDAVVNCDFGLSQQQLQWGIQFSDLKISEDLPREKHRSHFPMPSVQVRQGCEVMGRKAKNSARFEFFKYGLQNEPAIIG